MTRPVNEVEAERHRAKMAKRKAVQDAEVAEKKIETEIPKLFNSLKDEAKPKLLLK